LLIDNFNTFDIGLAKKQLAQTIACSCRIFLSEEAFMEGLSRRFRIFFAIGCVILLADYSTQAQYFGRNKPSYKAFDFKVYRTPHFEIYHYLKNDSVLNRLAQLSEQWYTLHNAAFKDSFTRNPILFYNDHADFQQTTAISGDIDIGTGGVTEALKNRVVLPIASTYAQTDHVLGHELVHAFQYHLLLGSDSADLNSLQYVPLWMVEGMAEYFSIGSVDPNTAMWMRDAIANNDFPTVDEMAFSGKYFPYRYGQCLWAFIGKTWGDSLIVPILKETSFWGYDAAIRKHLGVDSRTLSSMWKQALVTHYQKYMDVALSFPVGKKILFSKTAGEMNISPSVSPDGKYVIFYSEKDAFTFDLFLADAHSGKILQRVSSTVQNSEIDAFNYIESAGTWSPDGKKFAFPIFANGRNKLMIVNVNRGRPIAKIEIPGVPSFNNPAWSPDGSKIALSGMVEGQNALFIYDFKTKTVTRLTNDHCSYLQPSWSSDGKYIAFSTDKPLVAGSPVNPKGGLSLGIINTETLTSRIFPVFQGAKNLNPIFSEDDQWLYFLSDRDGFRNLYKFSIDSGTVFQLTNYFTGISGITDFAPAISMAPKQNLLCYNYYYGGRYSIFSAQISDFKSSKVNPDSINMDAATLPPTEIKVKLKIDPSLNQRQEIPLISRDSFTTAPYRPRFQLDYISNVSAGVSASRFGTGMAGSVFAMFSDISGQNQIFTSLAVNGEIYDFGGQAAYFNSKHKINWGVSISHIPYLYGSQGYNSKDSININGTYEYVQNYPMYIERIFEDKLSVFATRPLSATRRLETGLSTAYYYHRYEVWNYYYDYSNNFISSNKEKLPAPKSYALYSIDGAYVIDNSVFGMTGPIRGKRIRIGGEQYVGDMNFVTLLADYRRYWYVKPYTIAFKAFGYGRIGKNTDDNRLTSIYIGYPWYVRGYDVNTFVNSPQTDSLGFSINDLQGSRMSLASVEFRIPFFGPKIIKPVIRSGFLFTDLIIFCDVGYAWTSTTHPILNWKRKKESERLPAISLGASMRFNVLGYLVLEPFYAIPFQAGGVHNIVFGLNFLPGW
jgi:Tol biopolymer transport system component